MRETVSIYIIANPRDVFNVAFDVEVVCCPNSFQFLFVILLSIFTMPQVFAFLKDSLRLFLVNSNSNNMV